MTIYVLGIPVSVSYLTLIMIAIFAFDGYLYVKKMYRGEADGKYIRTGLILSVLVVISVVFHEFSHGLIASKVFGIAIKSAGISWWGAYVEPGSDMTPFQDLFVSLAGPMSNFILGGLTALYVWKARESLLENSVQYFALVNLKLGILNMLPIAGLDGASVLKNANLLVFGGSSVSYWIFTILAILILVALFNLVDDWIKDL